MASGSFRVKIPRAPPPGAETSPLAAPRPLETPTTVPGTFITAMPGLLEPTMKEVEVRAVNPPY